MCNEECPNYLVIGKMYYNIEVNGVVEPAYKTVHPRCRLTQRRVVIDGECNKDDIIDRDKQEIKK